MRIIIKSIQAELSDISTKEKNDYIILYWIIKYEIISYQPLKHKVEGEFYWRKTTLIISEILDYIKIYIKLL